MTNRTYKKYKKLLLPVFVVLLILGIWLFSRGDSANVPIVDTSGWGAEEFAPKPGEYENSDIEGWKGVEVAEYGFKFRYPPDFNVGTFPSEAGEGSYIVVQNADKRQGFQIYIRPFDEDVSITPERIRRDIGDIKVEQPQEVRFTNQEKTGLAFISDNVAFGGASREVWFTHGGRLYQISTYASLDAVLQKVMGTWTFQ